MSYDECDAAQDAYMERLFEQFYESEGPQIAEEAIAGFQGERLQSYFIANPSLVEPAARQLAKARAYLGAGDADTALVFAASAVDVGLKQALFRPIVYGLVHSEPAAVIIAELSLGHAAIDRFKNLLLDILSGYIGADLRTYAHAGATKTLWEEIKESQDRRNAVLHRGEQATMGQAEVALRSASAVVETVFPAVARAIGLHLHGGIYPCNKGPCKGQP